VVAVTAVSLNDTEVWCHVSRIAQASRSSFYWAMRLMPRQRRLAMFAIYAYCRELDDIADGTLSVTDKLAALHGWRQEVARVWQDAPKTETGRALVLVRQGFPIEREDLLAVIEGVATDAAGPVVRPSLIDFDLYCDRVAGAVGRLSVAVFGAAGRDGTALAGSLGRALQITNILRDIDEDGAEGRLYIPDEDLAQVGIDGRTPAAVLADPALTRACALLAMRAHEQFSLAREALLRCDRRHVRPAAVMLASYSRLLGRMERRGWAVRTPRARLSRLEKLSIGLLHGLL
jgi:squalene synthase HpnD